MRAVDHAAVGTLRLSHDHALHRLRPAETQRLTAEAAPSLAQNLIDSDLSERRVRDDELDAGLGPDALKLGWFGFESCAHVDALVVAEDDVLAALEGAVYLCHAIRALTVSGAQHEHKVARVVNALHHRGLAAVVHVDVQPYTFARYLEVSRYECDRTAALALHVGDEEVPRPAGVQGHARRTTGCAITGPAAAASRDEDDCDAYQESTQHRALLVSTPRPRRRRLEEGIDATRLRLSATSQGF